MFARRWKIHLKNLRAWHPSPLVTGHQDRTAIGIKRKYITPTMRCWDRWNLIFLHQGGDEWVICMSDRENKLSSCLAAVVNVWKPKGQGQGPVSVSRSRRGATCCTANWDAHAERLEAENHSPSSQRGSGSDFDSADQRSSTRTGRQKGAEPEYPLLLCSRLVSTVVSACGWGLGPGCEPCRCQEPPQNVCLVGVDHGRHGPDLDPAAIAAAFWLWQFPECDSYLLWQLTDPGGSRIVLPLAASWS